MTRIFRNKSTNKIFRLKGFGSRLEKSGKMTTMVWIIEDNNLEAKAQFIRACDFDKEFEEIKKEGKYV